MKIVFQANRGGYGSPRVHAELRDEGRKCARKRVARLMREQELYAKRPRHRTVTTHSDPEARVAPNLQRAGLQREAGPIPAWVADTPSIWTAEGWLYLAVVLDLFSRMGGGWSMAATQDATLVVQAALNGHRSPSSASWLAPSQRSGQYLHE